MPAPGPAFAARLEDRLVRLPRHFQRLRLDALPAGRQGDPRPEDLVMHWSAEKGKEQIAQAIVPTHETTDMTACSSPSHAY